VNSPGTIEVDKDGSASVTGELTFESAAALFKQTETLFRGPNPVALIDLAAVTAADSAGLALLLEWQAMQRAAATPLEIRNAPPGLISLARLCEADDVMSLSGRGEGR
jgi:phospholipid transport system transporter-binding protein